jgi:hypothetical protein
MSQYRDELDAARHKIEILEAKIAERDATLAVRDAEIAERDAEIARLRRTIERGSGAPAATGSTTKSRLPRLVAALGCLIVAGAGSFLLARGAPPRSEVEPPSDPTSATSATSAPSAQLREDTPLSYDAPRPLPSAGDLPSALLDQRFELIHKNARPCYEKEFAGKAAERYSFTATFDIDESGGASGVALSRPFAAPDRSAEFDACVRRVIEAARFSPLGPGKTKVSHSMIFAPETTKSDRLGF